MDFLFERGWIFARLECGFGSLGLLRWFFQGVQCVFVYACACLRRLPYSGSSVPLDQYPLQADHSHRYRMHRKYLQFAVSTGCIVDLRADAHGFHLVDDWQLHRGSGSQFNAVNFFWDDQLPFSRSGVYVYYRNCGFRPFHCYHSSHPHSYLRIKEYWKHRHHHLLRSCHRLHHRQHVYEHYLL